LHFLSLSHAHTHQSRPELAAKYLKLSADQGDEVSKAKLLQLSEDSQQLQKDAMAKLKALADSGNERAVQMLREFQQS
jgi:hypothetical protein